MVNYQDFNNSINKDINMVKGDSLIFCFELQGLEGANPYIIFSCANIYGAEPYFTVTTEDEIELVSYNAATDTATYSVRVAPLKTKHLDVARYYYDLELRLNDDIITLMRGRLQLLNEVTL